VIAAPRRSSVSFDAKTDLLNLPASAFYCVRVDVITKDADGVWINYAACLNASTGTIVVTRDDVVDVRVAFCLPRRFDVCSTTVIAEQGNSRYRLLVHAVACSGLVSVCAPKLCLI